MEIKRKPFQGVFNIIRFNWHFYLASGLILGLLLLFWTHLPPLLQSLAYWFAILAIITINISLLISFYIYDLSGLYALKWLPKSESKNILNISAGFDETSELISNKFPNGRLTIADFYDPKKHTEISIKRARLAYPPNENTIQVSTTSLPFSSDSFDFVLVILSAHEIREVKERIIFFKELERVTIPKHQIFVTEHLRDFNNCMAYTIGFFHFHSKSTWLRTFKEANLKIVGEIKTTPFITTFILETNGNTL
ncbi:methyltransferase [Putridiphycobacter roseus]|uniref:Methyltransferase n=1 Tax=Putridiphycobacter roseus TaxID=2219161 RepID=A0A2W1MUW9_9FLAO|nr:methyltransferase domain-containing protein [Putridiphycobacter roseus]PZE15859.1 methyltransferase [Putridiphycobacter roseus]